MEEMARTLEVSVVVPCHNEEASITELHQKLSSALKPLTTSYEIVFVDDGSTDNSLEVLSEINKTDHRVKIIRLRKRFGKSAALKAGFDYSKGKVIVMIDGDLQDDPADIPALLGKLNEGYDIVNGWRAERQDPFFAKKLPSKFANWLISKVTGVRLHDYGCGLKAFRWEAIQKVDLYSEMHRYLPAMASWMGFSIVELKVRHHPRHHGKSKYGLTRLVRGFLDLITAKFLLSYSSRPLQLFGLPGLLSFIAGFIIGAYLTVERLVFGESLANRPLLLLAILLMLVGIQFIAMGLLGEMLSRAYYEAQGKPLYGVRDIIE